MTTRQVARYLHLNEKKIYTLASSGKIPAVRISGKWLFPVELVDKHMLEKAGAPGEGMLDELLQDIFVIEGSDDFLFREVVFNAGGLSGYPVSFGVLGSSGGMDLVSRRRIHAATVHCIVDHRNNVLPHMDRDLYLIDLFTRQQGFMFRRSASGMVSGAADIVGRGLRFAVREKACGTYHHSVRLFEKEGASLEGYPHRIGPFLTHREAARAVAAGRADVALGIRRHADDMALDFEPLLEEDFYLMLPSKYMAESRVTAFIDGLLQTIRAAPEELRSGYDLGDTGKLIPVRGGRHSV
jgi:putative molybdopterin biosynthesis protein